MSDQPAYALPANFPMPPSGPPPRRGYPGFLLFTSCLFNFILLIVLGLGFILFLIGSLFTPGTNPALREDHVLGNAASKNKVAVVSIDGLIMEGLVAFEERQIEQAEKDPAVKAVVIRINSPGGSISASDKIFRRLKELRDGKGEKSTAAKPLVVSMGALAASGGYYVAMPARTLYAEPTTLTGSIGVYVALPNVHELTEKHGIKMDVIKRGAVKFAGSPFQALKPEEREMWQDMVDKAYEQFKAVVEEGRPMLKGKWEEKVINEKRTVTDADGKNPQAIQYVRQLADGGTYTASQALAFHLVDKIGYLEDAAKDAATAAGLGSDYAVVAYERPFTLLEAFMGAKSQPPQASLDPARFANALQPRLWYLAPGHDLAGMMAAPSPR